MIPEKDIEFIIQKVQDYIIKEDYKGYDPYDVLNSPIFKLPILRSNKNIRFLTQQIFRRIPFNLRPILGIKKEINPVTLGLCIQAFTYLSQIYNDKKKFYLNEINKLINKLIELKSKGYSGYCWGYNFDWEARYAKIPKFMPTIVATGIITNGLYEYYKIYKDKNVEEILISSKDFILNDLNRSYEGNTFCFSYSPNDNQKVYNATMKGARLLSQIYTITKDEKLIEEAEKTVRFVVNNQNEDGSWYYSKGDARKWIDNFHTAYVLDALKSFLEISGKEEYSVALNKGFVYYSENLFTKEGLPKYYSDSFYPIDSTAYAQSLITMLYFKEYKISKKIYDFIIKNFYSSDGYFYYRLNKFTNKSHFMRWSTAYMFLAVSNFYLRKKNDLV